MSSVWQSGAVALGDACQLIWKNRRYARAHAGMLPQSECAVVYQIHRM
jgi:hypothetical protein